jgi:helix-turn-helix protein
MTISKIPDRIGNAGEQNCRDCLLTPPEAAMFLRVSTSWLAKARMRGDGPPFVLVGRSIKYTKAALLQWTSANTHQSTSERDNVRRLRRVGRTGLKRNRNT